MSNIEPNDALNELHTLLQWLRPELNTLKDLIKDMAKINSPYQNNFNYIKILIHTENQRRKHPDIEKTITLVVQELNQFGLILEKISEDGEVSKLYLKESLLDKCVNLQKNMAKKLGFSV